VWGAGLHYPCDKPAPAVRDLGWTFLASEDYSRSPEWANGGSYWAKALSQNYVVMNMTSTIAWSLIWSVYPNMVCNGAGLMLANQPWAGWYEPSAPIWASAHTTQFATPGWRYLHVPGGGSGFLPGSNGTAGAPGGTYVTLVPPAGSPPGITIVIETVVNNDCIARAYANYNITFALAAGTGLPGPGTTLHVFSTTSDAFFVQQPDVVIAADGTVTVAVDADSIVTLSTTAGASHGTFPGGIPAAAQFPIPYADDFNSYPYDAMATYFADQGGSWAARNGSLVQVAQADPGNNGWAPTPNPLTIIGDPAWSDYAVAADVTFSPNIPGGPLPAAAAAAAAAAAQRPAQRPAGARSPPSRAREAQWRVGAGLPPAPAPRVGDAPTHMLPCDATDSAQRWVFGAAAPGYLSNTVGFSEQCLNVGGCLPGSIIYYQCVTDPTQSSCGAPPGQYPNLVWAWNASTGALTSAMDGWALTLNATDMQTMYLAPFAGPGANPLQVWAYNASSGALSLPAAGLCLSTPPVRVYAQVCGRITSYNGFDAVESMDGYCIVVAADGRWSLVADSAPVANGTLPAGFDPTTPHRLAVSMAGPVVAAYVDGARVAEVLDTSFTVGNAAVGSGWHDASFDNFAVTTPFPETAAAAAALAAGRTQA
jgi:hypothetical protein